MWSRLLVETELGLSNTNLSLISILKLGCWGSLPRVIAPLLSLRAAGESSEVGLSLARSSGSSVGTVSSSPSWLRHPSNEWEAFIAVRVKLVSLIVWTLVYLDNKIRPVIGFIAEPLRANRWMDERWNHVVIRMIFTHHKIHGRFPLLATITFAMNFNSSFGKTDNLATAFDSANHEKILEN